MKTPVESVSDKLIMSLEGLPTSNSKKQIDPTKCIIMTKVTIVLDAIVQNYFKESFVEDFIDEICSSIGSK